MSNPRPESRIKSLEQRASGIEADIVELANDTAEELRAIRQDIKELDQGMMASFKQIGEHFGLIEKENATKADLTAMEERIKSTMATKDDISNMATKDDIARLEGLLQQLINQQKKP